MEQVAIHSKMVASMMASGSMDKSTAKDYMLIRMAIHMKANFPEVWSTVKVLININLEIYIVEIINLISDMDMEVCVLLMVMSMLDLGLEMNFKERENTCLIKKKS